MAHRKLSPTLILHIFRLIFRSALFLSALALYLNHHISGTSAPFGGYESEPFVLTFIWLIFVVEMALRFFPSRLESMGSQKQFVSNYHPTGAVVRHDPIGKGVGAVILSWITLNGAIAALYFTGIIDKGILLLVSLFYSVCDIICILFFCPFQTWFMKNRCCGTCRIYNWNYAMMFTPLIFVDNGYAGTLVLLAIALLIKWEFLYHCHPERFTESTNQCLSCAECKEKLCHHKKQLHSFWKSNGRA